MTMLDWAKYYQSLGLVTIPVRPETKKPLFNWKEYQSRLPTDQELNRWFGKQAIGIGIVTGSISSLVVIDLDPRNGGRESMTQLLTDGKVTREELQTVRQRTPSGGWHFLFQYPGVHVPNGANLLPGLDVRGDGGYIVAAPSKKADGTGWTWETDYEPWVRPLAVYPTFALNLTHRPAEAHPGWDEDDYHDVVTNGVEKGSRDMTGYRLACHLLFNGEHFPDATGQPHYLNDRQVKAWLVLWARSCHPPIGSIPGEQAPEDWAETKIQSAIAFMKKDREQHQKSAQRDL